MGVHYQHKDLFTLPLLILPVLLRGGGDVLVELLLALELPFKVAAAAAGSAPGDPTQSLALALHSGCPVPVAAPRKIHFC